MAKDSDPVMITRRSAERVSGMLDWFDAFTENRRLRQAARHQRDDYPWLYEVTSVDAGSGTCTIQRRTSGDSADGREVPTISGVEYDADNEPNTGDIGEIARLGNGALFFFSRKAAAAGTTVYVPANTREVSEVGSSWAAARYTERYDGGTSSWGVVEDHFSVAKFDTEVTIEADQQAQIWVDVSALSSTITYKDYAGTVSGGDISSGINVSALLEDFTLSTLTRSDLENLTKDGYTISLGATGDVTPSFDYDHLIGKSTLLPTTEISSSKTIYGLAYWPQGTWNNSLPSPGNNDERVIETPKNSVPDMYTIITADSDTTR